MPTRSPHSPYPHAGIHLDRESICPRGIDCPRSIVCPLRNTRLCCYARCLAISDGEFPQKGAGFLQQHTMKKKNQNCQRSAGSRPNSVRGLDKLACDDRGRNRDIGIYNDFQGPYEHDVPVLWCWDHLAAPRSPRYPCPREQRRDVFPA